MTTQTAHPTQSPDIRPDLAHLSAWRQYRLLSQRTLAQASGVAKSTVTRLEGGTHANYLTIHRLARALGITPEQLAYEAPPIAARQAIA